MSISSSLNFWTNLCELFKFELVERGLISTECGLNFLCCKHMRLCVPRLDNTFWGAFLNINSNILTVLTIASNSFVLSLNYSAASVPNTPVRIPFIGVLDLLGLPNTKSAAALLSLKTYLPVGRVSYLVTFFISFSFLNSVVALALVTFDLQASLFIFL